MTKLCKLGNANRINETSAVICCLVIRQADNVEMMYLALRDECQLQYGQNLASVRIILMNELGMSEY